MDQMSQELSGQTVANLKMANNEVSSSDDSASASAASSPTSRVKFLCSHGGKIVLRPPDGHLKYVGGETRVIAVPRDLRFSDLMKKLKSEFESDVVLKYQVVPDDLDILVSVRTDEDLKHMLEEYDRHESQGITKFRAFLFPSNPTILEAQTTSSDPHAPEQRYIEAVNGMYRSGAAYSSRHTSTYAGRPTFSISACNSPNCGSPESNRSDNTMSPEHRSVMMNNPLSTAKHSMSRVRSSPSLCSLNSYQQQGSSSSSNFSNHNIHRPYPHYYQQQPQQQQQQHHPHSYQQLQQHKPPSHDPHRLSPGLPFSRHEMGRIPSPVPHHGLNQQQYYSSRHSNVAMGGAGNKYGYQDEHNYSPVYRNFDRMDSLRSSSRMGVDRVDMS